MLFESSKCDSNIQTHFKCSIEVVQTCMFTKVCFLLLSSSFLKSEIPISNGHTFLHINRLHIKAEFLQIVQHIKDIIGFIIIFGCG